MPGNRLSLDLTPSALDDQDDAILQSARIWGEEQAATYLAAINQALDAIRTHPGIGRARDDLAPGLRSLPVEQHVIYYRVLPSVVRIERILHRRRDAASALDDR